MLQSHLHHSTAAGSRPTGELQVALGQLPPGATSYGSPMLRQVTDATASTIPTTSSVVIRLKLPRQLRSLVREPGGGCDDSMRTTTKNETPPCNREVRIVPVKGMPSQWVR